MKKYSRWLGVCAAALVTACASQPDRFYTLNTVPEGDPAPLAAPTVHVILSVNLPVVVDRSEMVLTTSDSGLLVLDHERWAAPLSDQVEQTLARDIEKRRADILIGDRGFDQGKAPPVTMKIDIVRMSSPRGGGRSVIEAHWRIVDAAANMDQIGSDVFYAPLQGGGDYSSVAKSYSRALGELAAQLADRVRR